MNDNPHFGVATIDNPTLPSGQDKVNNIKRYGFSGRTGDKLDSAVEQRIHDVNVLLARNAEDIFDAFVLEAFYKRFRCFHGL
jgi:hypothetical protein